MTNSNPIHERWKSLPSLDDQHPMELANGKVLERYQGVCSKCLKEIHGDDFRGVISQPIPHVFALEAIGACRECRLFTSYTLRVKGVANGEIRIERLTPRGWEVHIMKIESKLTRFLRGITNSYRNALIRNSRR